MEISVKVVKRGKDTLVAACDCELLGKDLKFGEIKFPVRKDFYEGEVLSIDDVLKTIRQHLDKQKEARKYSEGKVAEFIESRARELEAEANVEKATH